MLRRTLTRSTWNVSFTDAMRARESEREGEEPVSLGLDTDLTSMQRARVKAARVPADIRFSGPAQSRRDPFFSPQGLNDSAAWRGSLRRASTGSTAQKNHPRAGVPRVRPAVLSLPTWSGPACFTDSRRTCATRCGRLSCHSRRSGRPVFSLCAFGDAGHWVRRHPGPIFTVS
ncbi:hypothetical protein ANANG_G00039970 [Anguilla anguilla]|uniref:Uncharacterized protein n=1 Tax=Anguilla anguilla TaxID=7936 RepID=A0A9D3MT76_ANGAN|nr:hypothetical protein ANANG_G00039970 [Anguilla anguilla]